MTEASVDLCGIGAGAAGLAAEAERERGALHLPDEGNLATEDLISFSGSCRVVLSHQAFSGETSAFSPETARIVEARRAEQAAVLKEVVVLLARTKQRFVASIAASQFVTDLGHMCSYPNGSYGLLGHMELLQGRKRCSGPST